MGEKRSETKDKILEVSLKLFSKRGFRETTIKDIAREVGITEGAIYRHFKSKDEIVTELLKRITSELKEKLIESIERGDSDKERLELLLESLMNYAFQRSESFRFLNLYHLLKDTKPEVELPGEIILKFLNSLYLKGKLKTYPEIALAVITGTIERIFIFREKKLLPYKDKELKEEVKKVIIGLLI